MSATRVDKDTSGHKPGWAGELGAMQEAYRLAGGNPQELGLPEVATLVVSANQVLMAHEIPGVHFEAESLEHGVKANIVVEPGAKIQNPVHLCFGLLPPEGLQQIIARYEIGAGAEVHFLAHCSFPNAVHIEHLMDADMLVGDGADFSYAEEHYHGTGGGTFVHPLVRVSVGKGSRFSSTFTLIRGRVGELELEYDVAVEERGVAELITKSYGTSEDAITVKEQVALQGAGSRGLTKTRVAVRDKAQSHVYTTMDGDAPGARGHMDCTEIVRGEAVAHNCPIVVVRDDQAQVTHEAAIGTVNRKELETLMARGLEEEEAVDLIVRGMLR